MHIVCVADEWALPSGGICSVNRMLVEHLAKHTGLHITVLLPAVKPVMRTVQVARSTKVVPTEHRVFVKESAERFKKTRGDTLQLGRITFLYAAGFGHGAAPNFGEWLMDAEAAQLPDPSPLRVDIVVGHGMVTGKGASRLAHVWRARYWHVVHTKQGAFDAMHRKLADSKRGEELAIIRGECGAAASRVLALGPLLRDDWAPFLPHHVPFLSLNPWVLEGRVAASRNSEETGGYMLSVCSESQFRQRGALLPAKAMGRQHKSAWSDAGEPTLRIRIVDRVAGAPPSCGLDMRMVDVRGMAASEEALREEIREAHAVLLPPSVAQTFGQVAVEALSHGVVVLASEDSDFAAMLRSTEVLKELADDLVVKRSVDAEEEVKRWEDKLFDFLMMRRDMHNGNAPPHTSWATRGEELRDAWKAAFPESDAFNVLQQAMSDVETIPLPVLLPHDGTFPVSVRHMADAHFVLVVIDSGAGDLLGDRWNEQLLCALTERWASQAQPFEGTTGVSIALTSGLVQHDTATFWAATFHAVGGAPWQAVFLLDPFRRGHPIAPMLQLCAPDLILVTSPVASAVAPVVMYQDAGDIARTLHTGEPHWDKWRARALVTTDDSGRAHMDKLGRGMENTTLRGDMLWAEVKAHAAKAGHVPTVCVGVPLVCGEDTVVVRTFLADSFAAACVVCPSNLPPPTTVDVRIDGDACELLHALCADHVDMEPPFTTIDATGLRASQARRMKLMGVAASAAGGMALVVDGAAVRGVVPASHPDQRGVWLRGVGQLPLHLLSWIHGDAQ